MNKKTAIILVIIFFLGVLFQTAVIIDYHSEKINFGFYPISNETGIYYKSLDVSISDEFFNPYDVVVRFDGRPFILNRDESLFINLWNDCKTIAAGLLTEGIAESGELWENLCELPGVTISMGSYFPVEYIEYMLNIIEPGVSDIRIDKIMLIPGEETLNVYFHTEDMVYESTGLAPYGWYTYDVFNNFTELISKDPSYSNSYYEDFYKIHDKTVWENHYEPDILLSSDLSSHYISWIIAGLPDIVSRYSDLAAGGGSSGETPAMANAAELIKSRLLVKSNNLYTTHFDSTGNLFFTNQFNMYAIDSNGWLTYRYTPGTEGDEKGNIGQAFINAYETLNIVKGLESEYGGEMFVSRIEENEDSYTFSFDYRYDSMPIVLKDENHSAVITATGTRTIEARVLPLEFRRMSDETRMEIPYIFNWSSNRWLNGISDPNTTEAYNIYVGYGTFSGSQNLLEPVWIYEKRTGEKEIYSLQRGN